MNVRFHIDWRPRDIIAALVAVALVLAVIDLLVQVPRHYPSYNFKGWGRLDRVFHLGREANVPTWYSTILLFTAGVLLSVIAAAKKQINDRYRWHWVLLALIFFYLSADEAAILHEEIGGVLVELSSNEFLRFGGWIGFAIIGMIGFAVLFLPFWWRLEPRTKWLFALAGVMYVGGAMAVESLSVPYENGRPPDYGWAVYTAIEETLEMSGVAVLIGALVHHLRHSHRVVEFVFPTDPRARIASTEMAGVSGDPERVEVGSG